jgi:hypothetical protein
MSSITNLNHMSSKFFGNKNDNKETNGKRQVKSSNKNSKKNFNSKLQSKGVGKAKMTGIRKVGRGN